MKWIKADDVWKENKRKRIYTLGDQNLKVVVTELHSPIYFPGKEQGYQISLIKDNYININNIIKYNITLEEAKNIAYKMLTE